MAPKSWVLGRVTVGKSRDSPTSASSSVKWVSSPQPFRANVQVTGARGRWSPCPDHCSLWLIHERLPPAPCCSPEPCLAALQRAWPSPSQPTLLCGLLAQGRPGHPVPSLTRQSQQQRKKTVHRCYSPTLTWGPSIQDVLGHFTSPGVAPGRGGTQGKEGGTVITESLSCLATIAVGTLKTPDATAVGPRGTAPLLCPLSTEAGQSPADRRQLQVTAGLIAIVPSSRCGVRWRGVPLPWGLVGRRRTRP